MPTRKVSKVLGNRDFLAVTPATPARDVAVMMRAAGQGAAIVVDRAGRLLGICTERDLVFRVMAEGRDPGTTPVRTVMSPDPQTVRADMLFGHALHLMHEAGVRHMPVVDGFGRPLGIVSSRDALSLEIAHLGRELEQRECIAAIL